MNSLNKKNFQSHTIFLLFLLCSVINLIGEGLDIPLLFFFSKPLLLFLLFFFFFKNTQTSQYSTIVKWMIIALFASNLGDILLLIAGRSPEEELFFLGGLSAFLLTHISYAIAFRKLTPSKLFRFPLIIIAPMTFFWIGFNYIFSPSLLGVMKPAVGIYSLVILVMVYFAWRLNKEISTRPTKWILWGALLFLLSDTFIGFNKFGQDIITIPAVGLLIMSTYLVGQALIVLGVIRAVKGA